MYVKSSDITEISARQREAEWSMGFILIGLNSFRSDFTANCFEGANSMPWTCQREKQSNAQRA